MKKSGRRFEIVPLAEALKNAVELELTTAGALQQMKKSHDGVSGNGRRHTLGVPSTAAEYAAGQSKADVVPQPAVPTNGDARRKRVLVVDDEQDIADMLADILRNAGYEAAAAYEAISGLAKCEAACPDLLIADVVMPGMNGLELAMVVKQFYPSCKVMLASEVAVSSDYLQEAREHGFDFEMIPKPHNRVELVARVAALT